MCVIHVVAESSDDCCAHCVDNNECSDDKCDKDTGKCSNDNSALGTLCDDKNDCTELDACDGNGKCGGNDIDIVPSTARGIWQRWGGGTSDNCGGSDDGGATVCAASGAAAVGQSNAERCPGW